MPGVTLAVISDLHCRLNTDPRESFLVVGGVRMPSNRHPVQSVIELIQGKGLTAAALLLPGDFANRASPEGLSQGLDYCLEIARHLGAEAVPVLGNHDVASRRTGSNEPVFGNVQNLRPDFPFADEAENRRFFSDGYAVIRLDGIEIIAINTVIDHTDEASAKRGTFGAVRIERMEQDLRGRLGAPFRIALMHHHPVVHSGLFLRDGDVLETGDQLLAALRRLGCRLIVHGHKHLARLTSVEDVAVLASGSFSAQLFEYGTSMGNMFHIIQLEGTSPDDIRGQIRTWVFRLGQGWKEADEDRDGFPFLSGFGRNSSIQAIAQALTELAQTNTARDRFSEADVQRVAPDVPYLTPSERTIVNQSLRRSNLCTRRRKNRPRYARGSGVTWRSKSSPPRHIWFHGQQRL